MLYISKTPQIPDTHFFKTIHSSPITHWIYLGEDSTFRVQADAALLPTVQRISIADILDQKSQSLRQPYIDWIGELSKKNSSLEWWASEIAAKNPYHLLFLRFCIIASVKEVILKYAQNNILVICSTQTIYDEIVVFAQKNAIEWKNLAHFSPASFRTHMTGSVLKTAKQIARTLPILTPVASLSESYRKFLETDLRYRQKILSEFHLDKPQKFSGDKTILFFTWIDRRNFSKDHTYADPYFGPLPTILKNRGYKVAFVPQILFTIPFKEAVEKLIRTKETVLFPELFLTMADRKGIEKRTAAFNPILMESSRIPDIHLKPLALEHISQTRELLLDTLRFEPMIRNMQQYGISPGEIIHTCEGHSWEQSLSWCVHHYMPDTKVIGYDNVTFSRMVLSMYPARTECGIRPLPDRIVTNGPLFHRVLCEEGFPPERVMSGCAIRHTYLWDNKNEPRDFPIRQKNDTVRILVATAIGLGDSVELVEKAATAFGGDPRFEVIVKCHPLVNPDEVKQYLGQKGQNTNIKFENTPIGELLCSADILFYTYTSVCYEAMMYGVMPVCVRSENFLNLDKLDATPYIRWIATTPEDLRNVVNEILGISEVKRKDWNMEAQKIVREALAPVTDRCIDSFIFQ